MYDSPTPAAAYPGSTPNPANMMTSPQQTMVNPMNNPSNSTTTQFAHGGLAHHGHRRKAHTIAFHASPKELDVLDWLQGSTDRDVKTGNRRYTKLEHLVKNPHIMANIHHHARQHQAHGGMTHAEAGFGRHGDTELGEMGPHLHKLMDMYAGHKTHNPYDGHPEYFSLGNFLGGIGNAIRGIPLIGGALSDIGQVALPMLGTAAGSFFGGPMGGELGGQLANGLGGAIFGQGQGSQSQGLGQMKNAALGMGQQMLANSPYANTSWGKGANLALDQALQGGSPQQALAAGAHGMIQNSPYAHSTMGQAAMSGLGALQQGQGLRQAALAGAQGGLNASPYASSPMGMAVNRGLSSVQQGASPVQAMQSAFGNGHGVNMAGNAIKTASQALSGGAGMMPAMRAGAQSPFNPYGPLQQQY